MSQTARQGHIPHLVRTLFSLVLALLLVGAPLSPTFAYAEADNAAANPGVTNTGVQGEEVFSQEEEDEPELATPEQEQEIIVRSGMSLRSKRAIFDYFSSYRDAPFLEPATTFNFELAQMSITMATCANRPIPVDSAVTLKPDEHLVQYLADCGFTDIRSDDYDKTPSVYTVATAMGSKVVKDENGEPFTLLAVGICGGNYKKEWLSNMTVGTGVRHQGFNSAANSVTDRIFGYLGSHHITGRVKIWLVGFSRAAAVCNLTAANLVDCGVFGEDNVFAYCFATPRTTKDFADKSYENIFNIVGPSDPIPQVAFPSWGYGRYGTTLYLPGEEYDSDFSPLYGDVQYGFTHIFESETYYNSKINLCLRLFLGMNEQLFPTSEDYDYSAQENLLSLLGDKSVQNVLRVLRAATIRNSPIPTDTSELEDQIIEFVGGIALDLVNNNKFLESGVNPGSVTSRIFHEHIEDLYLMWMYSQPSTGDLFKGPDSFTYLLALGDSDLTVEDASTGEPLYLAEVGADFEQLDAAKERGLKLVVDLYRGRPETGPVVVLALPQDVDYRVKWKATRDGEMRFIAIPCTTVCAPFYEGYQTIQSVKQGDEGIAYETQENRMVIPAPGTSPKQFAASEITDLLGLCYIKGGWRVGIMQSILSVCLALILLRAIVATINRWGSDEFWQLRFVFSSIAMLCLVECEVCYWLFASKPQLGLYWKLGADAAVLSYCFCCKRPGSKNFLQLFLTLATCVAGDIVSEIWFLPGAWINAIAHALFIRLFLENSRMPKPTWAWWFLLSITGVVAGDYVTGSYSDPVVHCVRLFTPLVLLMSMSGMRQKGNLRAGATLFVLADCLLGYYFLHQEYPYVHIASVVVYYLSLMVFSRSLIDEEVFIAKEGNAGLLRSLWESLTGGKRYRDDEIAETAQGIDDVLMG